MHEHFHHDIVSAAYITAVAVLGINVLRIVAAWLLSRGIGFGKTLGSVVAFP